MEKELFDDLLRSLKEAGAISKGQRVASRRFDISKPDVKRVREQVVLSQTEFAQMMRVSVKTLQTGNNDVACPLALLQPC